jgi:hypothetical protein
MCHLKNICEHLYKFITLQFLTYKKYTAKHTFKDSKNGQKWSTLAYKYPLLHLMMKNYEEEKKVCFVIFKFYSWELFYKVKLFGGVEGYCQVFVYSFG